MDAVRGAITATVQRKKNFIVYKELKMNVEPRLTDGGRSSWRATLT